MALREGRCDTASYVLSRRADYCVIESQIETISHRLAILFLPLRRLRRLPLVEVRGRSAIISSNAKVARYVAGVEANLHQMPVKLSSSCTDKVDRWGRGELPELHLTCTNTHSQLIAAGGPYISHDRLLPWTRLNE
jgi:hypothetical protein